MPLKADLVVWFEETSQEFLAQNLPPPPGTVTLPEISLLKINHCQLKGWKPQLKHNPPPPTEVRSSFFVS